MHAIQAIAKNKNTQYLAMVKFSRQILQGSQEHEWDLAPPEYHLDSLQ